MDWNDIKGCQISKLVIPHRQKVMGDTSWWHDKQGNLLLHLETSPQKQCEYCHSSFTLINLQDEV